MCLACRTRSPLRRDPFEGTIGAYIHNLIAGTDLRRLRRRHLSTLEDIELVVDWARDECATSGCTEKPMKNGGMDTAHLRKHLAAFLRRRRRVPTTRPTEPARRNLRFVQEALDLTEVEVAVLAFLVAHARSAELSSVSGALGGLASSEAVAVVAAALGFAEGSVFAALGRNGRLVSSGLVEVDPEVQSLDSKLTVRTGIVDALLDPHLDRDRLLARFLQPAPASTLAWQDFTHLHDEVALVRDLLRAAVCARRPGVNVLFHGSTGTGKSQLARLLSDDLKVPLFVAGRDDGLGETPSPNERLASLRLANRLAPPGQTLLVFDEMEDLFDWSGQLFGPSRANAMMSKQWFTELLETNAIPTVWITNVTAGIDRAFLRRFSYAIEFRPAGARQRAQILARHLGDPCPLSQADLGSVALRFEASPGQLGTAAAAARLVAGNESPTREILERLIEPVQALVEGRKAPPLPFNPSRYRLDTVCCTEDIERLVSRLSGWKPGEGPGLSLCLYGPSGTGKSELVRYLAWRMDRPLLYRRVSDLESPWVGVAEQNIAHAFQEAWADGAVLLFDEADSFLRDRGRAEHSWEVSRVNEFLQQLETFRGVVACTTNLMADLDQAALRRFIFKVEFRWLRGDQAERLFASTFPWAAGDLPAVARELGQLGRLAPGDFAAVSRRVRALQVQPPASVLLRMLTEEVSVKRTSSRTIGF